MDLRPSQGNENRWLCDGAVMARYVVTIVVLSLVFQAHACSRGPSRRARQSRERKRAVMGLPN